MKPQSSFDFFLLGVICDYSYQQLLPNLRLRFTEYQRAEWTHINNSSVQYAALIWSLHYVVHIFILDSTYFYFGENSQTFNCAFCLDGVYPAAGVPNGKLGESNLLSFVGKEFIFAQKRIHNIYNCSNILEMHYFTLSERALGWIRCF